MRCARLVPPRSADASRRGFTIVELLLAVIVVGVLASIALPNLTKQKEKALRAAAIGDLRTFASAQEAFNDEHGRYAATGDVQETPAPGKLAFRFGNGQRIASIATTRTGWSAEVRLASGTMCALAIGVIAVPTSVPGLVSGIPACEP